MPYAPIRSNDHVGRVCSSLSPRFQFGLYTCDPQTQARTQRRSAELFGEICAANALTAEMARRYIPDRVDELFPGVKVQAEVKLVPSDRRKTEERDQV